MRPARQRPQPGTDRTSQGQSFLNDPKMISLRESLDDPNFSLSDEDIETLQQLYAHLREYEAERSTQEDYPAAKKAKENSERVRSELQSMTAKKVKSISLKSGDRRSDFETKWAETAGEFDRQTKERRDYIIKRHKQAMDRFDAYWTNQMPQKYRKPSFRLLQLKQVEKTLAMSGEYDRASEVHKDAESLANVEQEIAQRKLVSDYRMAQQQLFMKQANELQMFDATRADCRKIIETKLLNEMNAAMNRDIVMQQKRHETARGSLLRQQAATVQRYTMPMQSKAERKKQLHETLLPPLKPPTDPSIGEEEERRRREVIRQKRLLERKREEERIAKAEAIRKFEEEKLARQRQMQQQKREREELDDQTFVTVSPAVSYNNVKKEEPDTPEDSGNEPIPWSKQELLGEQPEAFEGQQAGIAHDVSSDVLDVDNEPLSVESDEIDPVVLPFDQVRAQEIATDDSTISSSVSSIVLGSTSMSEINNSSSGISQGDSIAMTEPGSSENAPESATTEGDESQQEGMDLGERDRSSLSGSMIGLSAENLGPIERTDTKPPVVIHLGVHSDDEYETEEAGNQAPTQQGEEEELPDTTPETSPSLEESPAEEAPQHDQQEQPREELPNANPEKSPAPVNEQEERQAQAEEEMPDADAEASPTLEEAPNNDQQEQPTQEEEDIRNTEEEEQAAQAEELPSATQETPSLEEPPAEEAPLDRQQEQPAQAEEEMPNAEEEESKERAETAEEDTAEQS